MTEFHSELTVPVTSIKPLPVCVRPAEPVEQVLPGQGAKGDDQTGRAEDVSVAGAPYCLTPLC